MTYYRSTISNHLASYDEIITRVNDVMECGHIIECCRLGMTEVYKYGLGSNRYIITFVNNQLKGFELRHVYCFEL